MNALFNNTCRGYLVPMLEVTGLPSVLLKEILDYEDVCSVDKVEFDRLIAYFLKVCREPPKVWITVPNVVPRSTFLDGSYEISSIQVKLDLFLESKSAPSDSAIADAVYRYLTSEQQQKRITLNKVLSPSAILQLKDVAKECRRLAGARFQTPLTADHHVSGLSAQVTKLGQFLTLFHEIRTSSSRIRHLLELILLPFRLLSCLLWLPAWLFPPYIRLCIQEDIVLEQTWAWDAFSQDFANLRDHVSTAEIQVRASPPLIRPSTNPVSVPTYGFGSVQPSNLDKVPSVEFSGHVIDGRVHGQCGLIGEHYN